MRYDVEVGGRPHVVEVARVGGGWQATIDGRVCEASLVASGDRWSLLLRDREGVPGAARSYDVAFEPAGSAGSPAPLVHVGADVMPAAAHMSGARRPRQTAGAAGDAGRVVAPMPGRVVKVLVVPGERVEAGQGVVVVEAMKMENELRAPRAGVVRDVRAVEGASVDARAVLMVIE